MTRKKRLGRGLEALLNSTREYHDAAESAPADDGPDILPLSRTPAGAPAHDEGDSADARPGELLHLDVFEIDDNPFQPRRDFHEAEIASLAESLKSHDLLQPILVRRVADRFQLISGERRLRAAISAGWTHIPARIREADDRLVAELAIIENLQRKDLNAIEKALSFRRYLHEHGATQDELAERLKLDRSTIANLLRLLELPETVQSALRTGLISAGHARALLPLGEEPLQIDFCQRIQRDQLSVRQIEDLVSETIERLDRPSAPLKGRRRLSKSQQIESLEQQLKATVGAKSDIRQNAQGRGKIVIHFTNTEEFERIYGLLTGSGTLRKAG